MPHRLFLCVVAYLCCLTLAAQHQVVDSLSRVPIPFATVIVEHTQYGTVADAEGRFILPTAADTGWLNVSAVGYATRRVRLTELNNLPFITLAPGSYELTQVNVAATEFTRRKTVGGVPKSEKLICQFLHGQPGEQIGRRFDLGREALAKSASISVVATNADPVRCRLKFYPVAEDDSISHVAVAHADVFFIIDEAQVYDIDLSDFDIILPERVVMVVELVSEPQRGRYIHFGGALFKPNAVYRPHTLAGWSEGSTSSQEGKRGLVTLAPGFALTILHEGGARR